MVGQQDYRFVTGDIRITKGECHASCEFIGRRDLGDSTAPPYLLDNVGAQESVLKSLWQTWLGRLFSLLGN